MYGLRWEAHLPTASQVYRFNNGWQPSGYVTGDEMRNMNNMKMGGKVESFCWSDNGGTGEPLEEPQRIPTLPPLDSLDRHRVLVKPAHWRLSSQDDCRNGK